MAITHGYATGAQLVAYLAATAAGYASDENVERAIESASRLIDQWCGRRFWADTEASDRTYYPADHDRLEIDDAIQVTGLTVDGATATLANYDLLPLNGVVDGVDGWPTTTIAWPRDGNLPGVLTGRCVVTAKWGWAAVPKPVEQACLQLAAEALKLGEAPFGVAGIGGDGTTVRIGRLNPVVRGALQVYRKGSHAYPVA